MTFRFVGMDFDYDVFLLFRDLENINNFIHHLATK